VESTAQDEGFQEVKRRKKHISNVTSQTAKKLTKPVPTSGAVKLPLKAVLTRNFFTPLRTNDMDTETTGAENALPELEAPTKPGRPPAIVMTSTTNHIRLQSERVPNYTKWNSYHNKRNGGLFSHEILPGEK
jgi:hypothetical protein